MKYGEVLLSRLGICMTHVWGGDVGRVARPDPRAAKSLVVAHKVLEQFQSQSWQPVASCAWVNLIHIPGNLPTVRSSTSAAALFGCSACSHGRHLLQLNNETSLRAQPVHHEHSMLTAFTVSIRTNNPKLFSSQWVCPRRQIHTFCYFPIGIYNI